MLPKNSETGSSRRHRLPPGLFHGLKTNGTARHSRRESAASHLSIPKHQEIDVSQLPYGSVQPLVAPLIKRGISKVSPKPDENGPNQTDPPVEFAAVARDPSPPKAKDHYINRETAVMGNISILTHRVADYHLKSKDSPIQAAATPFTKKNPEKIDQNSQNGTGNELVEVKNYQKKNKINWEVTNKAAGDNIQMKHKATVKKIDVLDEWDEEIPERFPKYRPKPRMDGVRPSPTRQAIDDSKLTAPKNLVMVGFRDPSGSGYVRQITYEIDKGIKEKGDKLINMNPYRNARNCYKLLRSYPRNDQQGIIAYVYEKIGFRF